MSQDIFEKTYGYDLPQVATEYLGVYPYFQQLENYTGRRVTIDGKEYIMTGSNDYLGLSLDPRVRQAAKDAIDNYGPTCTGSRLLTGTRAIHAQLEEELADFLGYDKVLTFSAGYLASLSAVSTLGGRKDIYYFDRENHASLFDGAQISDAKVRKFKHNDLKQLRRFLETDAEKHPDMGQLIVVDSVYSMTGHVAPMQELAALAKEFGCRLMADEAHAIGILGKGGRGSKTHFDLKDEDLPIISGTFSKSFASVGGFIATNSDTLHWLKHHARPFIFTAAAAPSQVAATLESLRIMREEPEHHQHLTEITEYYLTNMREAGLNTMGSASPIVPVRVGTLEMCMEMWKELYAKGLYSTPAVPPAVPNGEIVIRTSVSASHTRDDVDQIVEIFRSSATKVGLI